jgi:Holliday junction DNA helicase RuvA
LIVGIEGILESRGADWAIIKVDGVSLKIYSPASTLSCLGVPGGKVQLHTHLLIGEDSIALYGFISPEELELFTTLIRVDGVGPKSALAMLSAMTPEQLALAISGGNVDLLAQLPGLGKKTASRLVLELKGKLEKEWAGITPSYLAQDNASVVAALTGLGYSVAEATQALAALSDSPELSLEEKIKLALQQLASR